MSFEEGCFNDLNEITPLAKPRLTSMSFQGEKLVVISKVGILVVTFEIVRPGSSKLQRGSFKDLNEIISLTRPKIHSHV